MSNAIDVAATIVAGVGSAAVVLTLRQASQQTKALQGQLRLQIEQAERAIASQQASNDLALMTQVMALDRLFIEQPDLRDYFYEGLELPENPLDRARVESTAELIVDLADSVATMIRLRQLDSEDARAWAIALGWYGRSPAVRKVAATGEGAWRPATLALLSEDSDEVIHPVGTSAAHSPTLPARTRLVPGPSSDADAPLPLAPETSRSSGTSTESRRPDSNRGPLHYE